MMDALIYFAGGCFWGMEKYFASINGVNDVQVGYANGTTPNPTYQDVINGSGHAEVVRISYNPDVAPLPFLLDRFYDVIDPTSVNRQGNDIGIQYRSGIYYVNDADLPVIENSLAKLKMRYTKPIAIEVRRLENYYQAEEYHQKYLNKNPNGYCHIGPDAFARARDAKPTKYEKKTDEQLRRELTPDQYDVVKNNATEQPFNNQYYDNHEPGIYVDVATDEPLFASNDKFDSGTGWPSFTKPINPASIVEKSDTSHNMHRTEVRSKTGDTHLGHVFNDGPVSAGGMRYCINSAALKFIPKSEMVNQGYGEYMYLFDDK